ncbi:Subunit of the glycosylphosphatidylinositol transamidase complex-like protein, partial [Tulasnella sp. 403]
ATYQLLHAFLPSESVCTENLTPFLKLLPCKGRSGLATLLNPHPLFDSNWHGIGVHVVWREDTGIEVKLTFGAVLDPVRVSRGKRDWSFSSLFGRSVSRACPVVSNSSVAVQLPVGSPFQVEPEPTFTEKGASFFDLSSATFPLDVALRWPFEEQFQPAPVLPSSPLTVSRVLTGGSWSQGGVLFNFINRQNVTQEVVSVETAPWFINYFLNTRMVSIDGERRDDIIIDTSYTLPNGHRPSRLETTLRLPPHSETQITMLFSKSFIAYTEHPPDAERGWDLPPAVISFADPNDPEGPEQRIYTRNLLIDLPTPDFSMPYNVIIMSSTVIALFFGSVFNLLTRKFVWVKTGETDVIH